MSATVAASDSCVIVIDDESFKRVCVPMDELTEGAGAPGGERLRELRRAAGRTQLWVEAEADLGTGYLQRLEAGKVAQPGADTLARILNALGARYSELRAIMERFGYTVATPLPTEDDIEWARQEARRDLDEVALPAYVLDCTHRLIAWNRFLRASDLIAGHAAETAPATASAARALIPVRLRVPGAGLLSFHLSSEPFARDARFRVIYYFPADPETMRWCAAWASESAT